MVFDWDDLHEGSHHLDLFHELRAIRPDFRATVFAIPALGTDRFWDSLPDWLEVAVHGWAHPSPREAEHWTYEAAMDVLLAAPDRFVDGFKAPGWQISEGTYRALMELGWWCADHPENNERRPAGLPTHVLNVGPDHWHGHIDNVCGNGILETWDTVVRLVREAASFEFISEAVTPWRKSGLRLEGVIRL
jgi:hypothetical protein